MIPALRDRTPPPAEESAESFLTDDLTGLHNRRGFLALAEQHLRMIQRKGAALLIYLDLDDLKLINDSYGHLEGNRAFIVPQMSCAPAFGSRTFWRGWAAMNSVC